MAAVARRDAFLAAADGGPGSATRGRTPDGLGGGGSLRRSRSLSRFPPPSPSPEDAPTPSSRFVTKVRGGGAASDGFPEISLDDLADEFFRARVESEDDDDDAPPRGRPRFPAPAETGRGGRRSSTARYARETESSRQRERSVSRPPPERRAAAENGGAAAARRQRYPSVDRRGPVGRQRYASVDRRGSVDRQRWCESDNDMNFSHRSGSRGTNIKSSTGHTVQNSFNKSKVNQTLRRSTSQNDFVHSRDSGSSHSSITDDESRDAHSFHSRAHSGDQSVYAQEKSIANDGSNVLYDVMRKEVRQAVEEIRTQFEKAVTKSEPLEKTSDDVQPTQVIGELRRNYTSKLEESEKRKQELLAQLAAEEQRGHELTKIVKELLPSTKKNVKPERQPPRRRRSNDKARVSKCLTEEAELYFEDFLSNVEDTDFSSFDGERSDTSSSRRDMIHHAMQETHIVLPKVAPPVVADGVVLPWLQWETSNDLHASPSTTRTQDRNFYKCLMDQSFQDPNTACSASNHTTSSSRGSWSPGDHGSSAGSKDGLLARFDEAVARQSSCPDNNRNKSFHMDDYLHLRSSEDFLFERLRQKQRIDDGGLTVCRRSTIM